MKKFLFALVALICYSVANADNSLELNIETPGTLKEKVLDSGLDLIESLTVSGRLNASDLEYLGSASGIVSHIKDLDIGKVDFVLDGEMYREIVTPTGSMGTNQISQYKLWPRDSVSGSYTLNGFVSVHWGNNLAAAFIDSNFEKVTVPESIDAIGSEAFSKAKSLKEIILGDNIRYIGPSAFLEAGELSVMTLPTSVDSIGFCAFQKAGNGLNLDLSSVSSFGEKCFNESGISSVILPNIDIDLPEQMFSECKQLTSITVPEKLKVLPSSIFYGCSSLQEVNLNEGLEEIGSWAFCGCAFETIAIPETVKVIGSGAFKYCINLSEANFPESLEVLGGEAFRNTLVEQSFPVENSISYFGTAAYEAQAYMPAHVTFRPGTTILSDGLFRVSIQIAWNRSD